MNNLCAVKNISLIILLVTIGTVEALSQNNTTSYPKVAAWNWAGGRPEWYAKFGLVIIWPRDATARYIHEINPKTIVLPTDAWTFHRNLPEEWSIRDGNGNIITGLGGSANMMDMTRFCPKVNGRTYNDYFIEHYQDFDFVNAWDGVASDWLWVFPWRADNVGIDLDRNGVNDYDEYGRSWVQDEWTSGIRDFLSRLRNILPEGKVILYNPGGSSGYWKDLTNGKITEKFPLWGAGNWRAWFDEYMNWTANGQKPSTYLVNAHGDYLAKNQLPKSNENYRYMRWGLASVCMGDGWYNYEAYHEHWYNEYYDEYDLDLGQPTSEPQEIQSNVFARFFDNGAVIVNGTEETRSVSASDLQSLNGYNGPYYHFVGNQDPKVNNGSLFTSYTLEADNIYGDGLFLLKSPDTVITEIIIDNASHPTTAGQSKTNLIGSWTPGREPRSSSNPYTDNPAWTVGPDWSPDNEAVYRYHWKNSGSGSASAIFQVEINVTGQYHVYEWHGWIGDSEAQVGEATNMPYTVHHANGRTGGTINLRNNPGKWNYLGKFQFNTGGDNKVVITDNADGPVIADALKFVFASGENEPVDTQAPKPPTGVKVDKP
ncbi:MAG: hypothetical protein ACE5JB_00420 [bacterium]